MQLLPTFPMNATFTFPLLQLAYIPFYAWAKLTCTDINPASLHDNPGSRPDSSRTSNFLPLTIRGGGYTTSESPPPAPATTLCLNPCPGHPYSFPLGSNPFYQPPPGFPNGPDSLNVDPFDGLASSCSRLPDFGRKRYREAENSSSGDQRNKRMIKNRESAAR
ncbi:hypothetical protein Vadar_005889 [Vaccinium darrowii]|uniref:Uncharacterized protein n=1 Tax=Vaccinium darrowii TaxID=229202 RepID=A0ACB7X832_9ERIC|nr:hypothetical protein Vadar_005889 [Vaccinium darrowii]